MTVTLDRVYARSSPQVRSVVASPAVGEAEPTLRLPGTLEAAGTEVGVFLELVDPGGRLWQPTVSAGSFDPGSNGILITEKAADDLGVGVGDRLTLRHPRRAGPTSFETAETTLDVAGLTPDPLRFHAYLDSAQARLMGLEGMTNTLSVTPAAGVGQDGVTTSLFGKPGVASVARVTASLDAVEDYLQDFTAVFQVSALVVMLLALLIAFNSTSINADERVREHATMFAFGLPVRSALAMSVAESLIKGILATLLGLGLGLALIGWVFYAFLPEVAPELGGTISLSTATYTAAVLVGVVASALAPLLTARRLRRMDVPSSLRLVE
jgi:putative ABC transport system permease protein